MQASHPFHLSYRGFLLLLLASIAVGGCRQETFRVAVIPRTTALTIWEAVHAGVEFAADPAGIQVYWNAPTSEDDIQQQAALIDRVIDEHYRNLIVAPDQPLALMAPVQRALSKGIHTVVIASPLPIPPQKNLAYFVNDDEATGRMAAARIGYILRGKGSVAVLGIDPESLSDLTILHSFETALEKQFPQIVIVDRRTGTHYGTGAQQVADEAIRAHPGINSFFSLSAVASYGTIAALQARGLTGKIKVIGFEQSVELGNQVRSQQMDSLIAEDTYQMGYRALTLLAKHRDTPLPAQEVKLAPTLLTRDNIDTPAAQRLINRDWGRKPSWRF